MIPRTHALRACLALKLWAIERKSHVMALVADEGLGLFCGLNRIPKKSYLSEYSSRTTPKHTSALLGAWHTGVLGCCFPLYLVRSPSDLTGLFGRRIS